MTTTRNLPRWTVCLLTLLLAAMITVSGMTAARAAGVVESYVAQVQINPNGSLDVEAVITAPEGLPEGLTQEFRLREEIEGQRDYVFSVIDVRAEANGQEIGGVSTGDDLTTVPLSAEGATEVTLSYTVTGASVSAPGNSTLVSWDVLQGLSAQVNSFSAEVGIPGQFTDFKCVAGPPGSQTSCSGASGTPHDGPNPTFFDGPRGENEIVGLRMTFPSSVVAADESIDERWTVARAFQGSGWPLAVALATLVLGAIVLFALHRRAGRDANPGGESTEVARFVPAGDGVTEFQVIGDVLPGEVGTVADERVDPIDVTATLVDLAVRGFLLIVELPRKTEFSPTDWKFQRRAADESTLHDYERDLLDAVTPKAGREVLVSKIGPTISGTIPAVQSHLYDEVVRSGWYERRPDSTRNVWNQAALISLILAVVATGLLAAFTSFGLTGLVLIALALGLAFVAQEMPARTARGARLLEGLGALRSQLMTQPTDQLAPGRELDQISRILPYAIVLGGQDRWLEALVKADDDPEADSTDLSWYHGPANWHLRDLPDSLQNFLVTVSGNLFAR